MKADSEKPAWYYQPLFVLIMLFFVLGPFGLPLLYKSPCFAKAWKIILTIAVVLFTVYLVVFSYQTAMTLVNQLLPRSNA